MGQDTFNTISIADNLVHIYINEDLHEEKARLFLLGTSGEELQKLFLPEGLSIIDLHSCAFHTHAVRLETNCEVQLKQLVSVSTKP